MDRDEALLRGSVLKVANTCANPSCFAYPMRGSNLCMSCSTKRDALWLVGLLGGGLAIFAAILRFC